MRATDFDLIVDNNKSNALRIIVGVLYMRLSNLNSTHINHTLRMFPCVMMIDKMQFASNESYLTLEWAEASQRRKRSVRP